MINRKVNSMLIVLVTEVNKFVRECDFNCHCKCSLFGQFGGLHYLYQPGISWSSDLTYFVHNFTKYDYQPWKQMEFVWFSHSPLDRLTWSINPWHGKIFLVFWTSDVEAVLIFHVYIQVLCMRDTLNRFFLFI